MKNTNWTVFWRNVRGFLAGAMELARTVWHDPLARAFLLWLVSRWIPNAKALTIQRQACLKSTDTMSTAEGLRRCREYGLEGPAGYLDLPVDTVDKVWNGMGPDSFSIKIRLAIDKLGACIFLCSLPHDLWFVLPYNDGTLATYKIVDAQWVRNSDKLVAIANKEADWWGRRWNEFSAKLSHDALEIGAYEVWKSAFKRGDSI